MKPLEIILKKEPYIQLTIDDGVVYELRFDKKSNLVMEIPEIELVEKLGYEDKEHSVIEYRFSLNSITDSVWRKMFYAECGGADGPFKIHGNQLDIQSSPKLIQRHFETATHAIKTVNDAYSSGRDEVVEYATRQDEERARKSAEERRVEEERQQEIQESYESLTL